jgi:hypothetical protein
LTKKILLVGFGKLVGCLVGMQLLQWLDGVYNPEKFVHNWLKMPAFKAAYEEFIRPCRSQHFWTTTEFVAPIPPLIKRKAGRPKKKRRKGEDEGGRPGKMKKNTIPMHCGRCQSSKHNLRSCPQPAPVVHNQPVEINSSQSAPTSQVC